MSNLKKYINTVFLIILFSAAGSQAGEIHDAVLAGNLDKVRELIKADPTLLESQDNDGNTPLIRACFAPPTFIPQAAVANFLIDKGANINSRNNNGGSPVYFAHRDFDLMQRLIANGADVNIQAYGGLTPLHQAVSSGNLKVSKLLIDHEANLDTRSQEGTILQRLINKKKSNVEMARLLVESGARLEEFSFGNTELHLAAIQGYAELVPILVARGADVNAVNDYNHTALYYAAKHGHRKTADALLAAGANKSAIVENNYGKAPQLVAKLKEGEAYLWYLGGGSPCDSYAVKTKEHLLIFNPYMISESPDAGLANGYLNPKELAGQKITVLINHHSGDRYTPGVTELVKALPDADFIINFKPPVEDDGKSDTPPYRLATPNESFSMDGIQVHTIPAMLQVFFEGEGLGYLVQADGLKIFHPGLHVSNNEAAQIEKYRREIDFLKPFGPIDIAILPIKGRHVFNITYEPYLYLIDQLAPKAVYLIGDDLATEEHEKCVEVLQARNIPVAYPEGGIALGERFHYLRTQQ